MRVYIHVYFLILKLRMLHALFFIKLVTLLSKFLLESNKLYACRSFMEQHYVCK